MSDERPSDASRGAAAMLEAFAAFNRTFEAAVEHAESGWLKILVKVDRGRIKEPQVPWDRAFPLDAITLPKESEKNQTRVGVSRATRDLQARLESAIRGRQTIFYRLLVKLDLGIVTSLQICQDESLPIDWRA